MRGSHFQFVEGDVRDFETLREAMWDVSAVFHFAAQVAVGAKNFTAANEPATFAAKTWQMLTVFSSSLLDRFVIG
jgi:nucleoside-diphosphate-sugar epimerase